MNVSSDPIRFLFWDRRLIERLEGGEPVAEPAKRVASEPMLLPERPYEFNRLHLYGSVIRDPEVGRFRMWYSTHGVVDGVKTAYLCLAESEDGLRWERPELDVMPGTNIVLDPSWFTHGPTVIHDPADPDPERRYKLMMKPSPRVGFDGIACYVSPDGIHWKVVGEPPAIRARSDCHIGLARHPRTGVYHATLRMATSRRMWLTRSTDFQHWSPPVLVFEPDDEDPYNLEFYSMPLWFHGPYALGLVNNFNTDPTDLRVRTMHGSMDISLAFSREDAHCWHWLKRGARIVELGEPGSWDCGCVLPASAPVLVGNEFWFYYSGFPVGHAEFDYGRTVEGISCAKIPCDRLRGLRAKGEASLLTRPFAYGPAELERCAEPGLQVNAALPAGASLRVGLTDETGQPIAGCSIDDCQPITGDVQTARVAWKSPTDWKALARTPLRIQVEWSGGTLYALGLHGGFDDPTSFREIPAVKPPDWDLILSGQIPHPCPPA